MRPDLANPHSTQKRDLAHTIPKGRHGHRAGRLRLHHQDGVGWGQRGDRHHGCEDEDTAARQRDCGFVSSFTAALSRYQQATGVDRVHGDNAVRPPQP